MNNSGVKESLDQSSFVVNVKGVIIKGQILTKKSEEIAIKLVRNHFKANCGWLSNC